jgi:hypothetical protein
MSRTASSSAKSYQIQRFRVQDIVPGMTIVLIGKRHSGKSMLMRNMVHELKDQYPTCVVFSGSDREDPMFSKFLPLSFVYDGLDTAALKRVLDAQQERVRVNGLLPSNRMLIVLDDVMEDANVINRDKTIKRLFFQGRHFNVTLVIALQVR